MDPMDAGFHKRMNALIVVFSGWCKSSRIIYNLIVYDDVFDLIWCLYLAGCKMYLEADPGVVGYRPVLLKMLRHGIPCLLSYTKF